MDGERKVNTERDTDNVISGEVEHRSEELFATGSHYTSRGTRKTVENLEKGNQR